MPILNNQIIKSVCTLLFLIGFNSYSQQKTKKHKIQKGETITSIAKDNNVPLKDIYALNPNSNKILKLNSVLIIPVLNEKKEKKERKDKKSSKKEVEIIVEKTHEVLPKETLYGISKKYKISIENLKKWNPILENAAPAIGQIINIAENKSFSLNKTETSKQNESLYSETIIHEVLAKETKYSLSKRYNISIQTLEELNPEIVNGLPIGYKLILSKSNSENNISKIQIEKKLPEIESEIVNSKEIEPEIIQTNDTLAIAIPITNLDLANTLEQRAKENIGTRYHSGGTKPGGFDCSGLMIYTFENSGIKLPRTSTEQSNFGTRINKKEAQKGDLIFFSTRGRGHINHVGMVVENIEGEIKFIHSSSSSGVMVSSLSENYYQRAFRQINRVLD
jgi:peptidoglycan DL-endopeptidase LytE